MMVYRDYGYDSPGDASGPAGEALATRLVSIIAGIEGVSTICELGCGNGYLASLLGRAGHAVTGIDASTSGIEIATSHYRSSNIRFIRADLDSDVIGSLPGAGSFDAVVSSDVIEHLYRPSALVEAAATLLKPGGVLVLGTPYHGYLKNLAISLTGRWDSHHAPNWDGGHIKFFSPATLKRLLNTGGFNVCGMHYHGRARWLWKNMICVSVKNGYPGSSD
jgi:2-polyprenyl-6-hydroxyphenyl methylase/3-demethylubiquinone-9 3-methyltransferase